MDSTLADVDFLSGSKNRVRVLELLSEAAHTRRELQETVGVSRSTVNRILDDFEARGWVEADGKYYRASPPGALLSGAFGSLLETAEQVAKLVVVVRHLPPDIDFDPRHMADAEIIVPNRSDVVAPARRSAEYMRRSRHVRLLVPYYTSESLRANRDAVVEDGQSLEVVVTTGVLSLVAADPEATAYLTDILREGGEVYRFDEELSCGVAVCDGRYMLGLTDEQGAPRAFVETADETVGAWIAHRIDDHVAASERLDVSSWAERAGIVQ